MKKISFFSLITIAFFSFLACGKNGNTRIEGQVLEKGSNKPVAAARVIFSQCVKGEGFGSSAVCIDTDEVLTDAQGNYTFIKEDDSEADSYRIRAEKTNYGNPVEVFQRANAGEKTKDLNFTLPAHAWIKFRVKNVNPFDEYDLIIAPGAIGGSYELRGKYIDTTYIMGGGGYLGNFKNNITWTIERQFKRQGFSDSIFCNPLDTMFYEIKY